jgi:hypothetical protein
MRRITKCFSFLLFFAVALVLAGLASQSARAGDKPKAEDVVSKHLNAIGLTAARADLKSLSVEGSLSEKYLRGGTGQTAGPFSMVSAGHKLIMQAKFGMPDFPGEFYAFDGDKKTIGFMKPGQRSLLEDFIQNSGEVVQEGLFGGVLTTAWPLYDLENRKARLDVDGMKKIDGKDLLRLTYHPRHGSGDLKIYLFFDPETFRHVKTIYTLQSQGMMGTSANRGSMSGAGGGASNQTLEEDFGGFSNMENLMLPTQWTIKYNQEGLGAGSSMIQFDVAVEKVQANPDVAGVSFRIGN